MICVGTMVSMQNLNLGVPMSQYCPLASEQFDLVFELKIPWFSSSRCIIRTDNQPAGNVQQVRAWELGLLLSEKLQPSAWLHPRGCPHAVSPYALALAWLPSEEEKPCLWERFCLLLRLHWTSQGQKKNVYVCKCCMCFLTKRFLTPC